MTSFTDDVFGDGNPVCRDCGTATGLNADGRCAACQELFTSMAKDLTSEQVPLDDLAARLGDAADGDAVMDILAKATPPTDKMEQQRTREKLLRVLRNKVSSPSKVVDAWLGSRFEEEERAAAQASQLVLLVQERDATLFHTSAQQAFAAITVDGHREVMPIRSRAFRLWLARAYWEFTAAQAQAVREAKTVAAALANLNSSATPRVPGAQALADATATLEGMAIFAGEQIDVHVRVAHFGENVYLDLGNDKWEAVEVTRDGWRVVPLPPVMFRRPPGLEALPHPEPGGSIDELRPFLNVTDEDWPLAAGYMAGMLSAGPFAVLVLLGEQGTAKSTAAKVFRRTVDPNTAPLRRKPRSDHDLAIAANNGWTITVDNLSSMPVWLSDAICTLATGGGFATRQLYSDADEQLFASVRPVILNGIGDIVARSDLLDRALLLQLNPIQTKIPEAKFWADFEQTLPRILGAVLDATSAAIGGVDDVELDETPRMVDFTRWVVAAEASLGLAEGAFLATYLRNRSVADQTALDASPIGRFIVDLLDREKGHEWTGTATALLSRLNALADQADGVLEGVGPTRRQEGWPKAANTLSSRLKMLAPNLRRVGVDLTIGRDEGGSTITLTGLAARYAKDRQDRQDRQDRGSADGPDDADDEMQASGQAGPDTQPHVPF